MKGKAKEREQKRRDAAFAWQQHQVQHQVQQQQQFLTPPLSQTPASSPPLPSPDTEPEPLRFVVFAATASSSDIDTCEWHWKPFLAFRIAFLPNKEWYFSIFKNHVIYQLESNANMLGLAAGLDSTKDTCLIGMYHNNAKAKPPIKVQLLADGWSGKLPIAQIVKQLGWRTGKDQKDDDVNQETVYTVSILYVPRKREEEREVTPASSAFDTFSQLGSILDIPEPEPPAPVPSTTQDQPVGVEAAESTEQAVGHTAQANSHRRRISAVVPRAERVDEGRPSRRRRAPVRLGEA